MTPPTIAPVEAVDGMVGKVSPGARVGGGRVTGNSDQKTNIRRQKMDSDSHTGRMCWRFNTTSVLIDLITVRMTVNVCASILLIESPQREVVVERHSGYATDETLSGVHCFVASDVNTLQLVELRVRFATNSESVDFGLIVIHHNGHLRTPL